MTVEQHPNNEPESSGDAEITQLVERGISTLQRARSFEEQHAALLAINAARPIEGLRAEHRQTICNVLKASITALHPVSVRDFALRPAFLSILRTLDSATAESIDETQLIREALNALEKQWKTLTPSERTLNAYNARIRYVHELLTQSSTEASILCKQDLQRIEREMHGDHRDAYAAFVRSQLGGHRNNFGLNDYRALEAMKEELKESHDAPEYLDVLKKFRSDRSTQERYG